MPAVSREFFMSTHNQFPERRKYTRFQVKDRSCALHTQFGPIIDISMDGLAFLHAQKKGDLKKVVETGMLFAGKTPVCEQVSVKIISDQDAGGGSALLRRAGLQFGDLTQEQLAQLESFIVKGQKLDLEKIKPTYEEMAARVRELERVVIKLEEKQKIEKIKEIDAFLKGLSGENNKDTFLLICSYCKDIKDEQDNWQKNEKYIGDHFDVRFSHGICPACSKKHYPHLFGTEE